jgi:glucokinase
MYNLGIDIGGTNLRAGIVDKNGTIIMRIDKKIDRDKNVEKIVFDIEILINRLLKQVNMSKNNLKSIGIGIPGIVK